MSQEIIQQWLEEMTQSVANKDLNAHMELVSKNVRVYGVPGHEVINYQRWLVRRRNEFEKNLLASLIYSLKNVKTIALRRLAFNVEEIMTAVSGQAIWLNKDIILEQEKDDKWRVVEEKINQWHLKEI